MPIIKCDYCGKEVYKTPSKIAKYKNHFCSIFCNNKSKRKENNIIIKDNHAEIIIKKEDKVFICLFDIEDIEKINYMRWNLHRRSEDEYYYVVGAERNELKEKRIKRLFHRLVMNCPDDMVVDHINHNTLDNRKCNLRVCTRQQNTENRKSCNITNVNSGYRNVYWCKDRNKWRVRVMQKGKSYHAGFFVNIEDAIKVAEEMRNKYFIIEDKNND